MQNKTLNIAVVGATGLVGRTMLKVLEERNFPFAELKLLASVRSAGTKIQAFGKEYIVEELTDNSFENIDIALFSAGGGTSLQFAPAAVKAGCIVIDNSSAWRMDSEVPLIVPEVNPEDIKLHKGIIANPNCSTIQLMPVLDVLHKKYTLKRVICSTYQSISGAGQAGVDRLLGELEGNKFDSKHQIAFNTMFHTVSTSDENTTEEELKMVNETRKILHIDDLPVSYTCVRLPILGGHAESVNIELENEIDIEDIRKLLNNADGIEVADNLKHEVYPTPQSVSGKDNIFIGRIRRDLSAMSACNLWVVADNIRKGAATNAVQIALKLIELDNPNLSIEE